MTPLSDAARTEQHDMRPSPEAGDLPGTPAVHRWSDNGNANEAGLILPIGADTLVRPMTADSNATPPDEAMSPKMTSPMSTFRNSLMNTTASSAAKLRNLIQKEEVVWYWKHKSGFKPYDAIDISKIERAYQEGESKVRLKTGKFKSTPMEIFFEDMIQHDPITGNTREVMRHGPKGYWMRAKRFSKGMIKWLETGRPRRELFSEYQNRRKRYLSHIDAREYDVCDFYKDTGLFPTVAKSNWFFGVTMAAVVANSLWIAYDADYNTAPTLSAADTGFKVVEYFFCVFFSLELLVRFLAFRRKRDCLGDRWFVFDLALLAVMWLETWIVPLSLEIFTEGENDRSGVLDQFYVFRMFRLLRLTRMARLLKLFPDMLTLLKGMSAAIGGVVTTLALLVLLLFVFAIIFKAATADSNEVASIYFSGVVVSMRTLLMYGTLLDSPTTILILIYEKVGLVTAILWLVFIFISSFTVLNMLIGILCEVVSQVSQSEKEEAEVNFLKNNLMDLLECYDRNNDKTIGEDEFDLLMQNIELHECLTRFGTDVSGIIALKDVLFEGRIKGLVQTAEGMKLQRERRSLSFKDFMTVVLRLRGGHYARVTDIVELREYMRQQFERVEPLLLRKGFDGAQPAQPEVSQRPALEASARPQVLKVAILGARGLRNADLFPGSGKSDVYCVCCIIGKPHMISRTRTLNDTLEPVWNHEAQFDDYQSSDCLQFDVMDQDVGFLKKDDHLGRAVLASSRFYPHGFEGELRLEDAGASGDAYLKVRIPPLKPAGMTAEQMLETVLTKVGEVCEGQQQLRGEVRALYEKVQRLQSKVECSSEALEAQEFPPERQSCLH